MGLSGRLEKMESKTERAKKKLKFSGLALGHTQPLSQPAFSRLHAAENSSRHELVADAVAEAVSFFSTFIPRPLLLLPLHL